MYTLYRSSVLPPAQRIHVATFDAAEREGYNAENCALVQHLFQLQREAQTKFWCEKGRYRQ